ncbi:DUF4837 family protein [Cellulophaga sp. E16_2]|uniref:DUF4837 domain-containing protein n=1 Tax=Cellulophaga algicola (strain DSM 14237 / IC166 / ACAM 630) TaxID=688270 RepID=E6XAC0_CELAD|nr:MULTISPECIES: DUF4837 family protein [Cellulophaga]ADV48819.1 hypothetical protein Celal_1507 [Cellulophaga algicola DSM 14237]MBO0591291.1 DUF4837 family protein [Cellulophaga sp. E16_2]
MKKIVGFFAIVLLFVSCKDDKSVKYLPESIGAINSLAVVMDNELWQGEVGDKVREHFAAPVVGLTLEEPLFTINYMPPSVFTGSVQHSRSVLYVTRDSTNKALIKTDVYAKPQKVGVISGKNIQEIKKEIDAKADEIIKAFRGLEISEAQKRFKRSLNKDSILSKNFKVSLDIPSAYRVGRQEDNFVWYDRQVPKGTMNVIMYTMPEDYFKNDSTLVKDILRMRDSIGSIYIPGEDIAGKKNHMVSEKMFAPHVYPAEIGGKKAVEVRGLWEMSDYPMGGPYLLYIINDKENNRKLIVEGFTFAPASQKRDNMFELEAIMKTIAFR